MPSIEPNMLCRYCANADATTEHLRSVAHKIRMINHDKLAGEKKCKTVDEDTADIIWLISCLNDYRNRLYLLD